MNMINILAITIAFALGGLAILDLGLSHQGHRTYLRFRLALLFRDVRFAWPRTGARVGFDRVVPGLLLSAFRRCDFAIGS